MLKLSMVQDLKVLVWKDIYFFLFGLEFKNSAIGQIVISLEFFWNGKILNMSKIIYFLNYFWPEIVVQMDCQPSGGCSSSFIDICLFIYI